MVTRRWAVPVAAAATCLQVLACVTASGAPERAGDDAPLAIFPTPQQVTSRADGFELPATVGVVAGPDADRPAVDVVSRALRAAGVRRIQLAGNEAAVPRGMPVVTVGTGADAALDRLGIDGPDGLPAEGYVLGIGHGGDGRNRVVLAGDATGTFYAAQSLRQLITRSKLPGIEIRDWPTVPVRAGMESFYGPLWSHADRVEQLRFLGRQRMNTFLYCPFEDRHTNRDWRKPYDAKQLAKFRDLLAAATANHVEFVYRINPEAPLTPEASICHASEQEFELLTARLDQLWAIGVRKFVVGFDDVQGQLCELDQQRFGSDASPLAAAQAHVLNRLQREWITAHPEADPLIAIPTEYWGLGATAYKRRWSELVDPAVVTMWTGREVISPAISAQDTRDARALYGHDLMIFDNYPVNDYVRDRLLLGPLAGREPGMASSIKGYFVNEMNEQEASKIALFTQADFAWNPAAYDAERSWTAALRDLGGSEYDALRTFAENSRSSALNSAESPVLTPLISAFRTAADAERDLRGTAEPLLAELAAVRDAPERLRNGLENPRFLEQAEPYLDKLQAYGAGGTATVRLTQALARDEDDAAWRSRVALDRAAGTAAGISQRIAAGVFEPFFGWATVRHDLDLGLVRASHREGRRWSPVEYGALAVGSYDDSEQAAAAIDGSVRSAYRASRPPRAGEALTIQLPVTHRLNGLVILQDPDRPAHANVQVRRPDGSWQHAGTIRDGHFDAELPGARADAIRLVWLASSPPPTVHEVIPVYADALPATGTAGSTVALAGQTRQLNLNLDAMTATPLSGELHAGVPDGWTVTAQDQPFQLSGDARRYPVGVTIPTGTAQGRYPVDLIARDGQGRILLTRLIVHVVSATSYPGLVSAADPIGYWRFGERTGTRAEDLSGSSIPGTYVGPVSLGRAGVPGADGDTAAGLSGGYIDVPDSPTVSLTTPFTLEAWVRLDRTGQQHSIIEKYDRPSPNGYALRINDAGRLEAYTLGSPGGPLGSVAGQTVLTPGQWHHVAAVYDGAQLVVYLDGERDGVAATQVNPTDGAASLKLGARGDDANTRLAGDLDEAAIYAHALSAEQIASHYRAGAAG